MRKIAMKIFSDKRSCEKLATLVKMGKAQVVKEFNNGNPNYLIFSASGSQIGAISKEYQYLFADALNERGAGDGLWPGLDQTTSIPMTEF
jgi:hypothetical protein